MIGLGADFKLNLALAFMHQIGSSLDPNNG
jgi:hypothetical protein